MKSTLFVLAGLIVSAYSLNFMLNDCLSNSANQVIRLGNASLSPAVIHLPGEETGSVDLEILKPLSGNHYRLDVVFEKFINHHFVALPCYKGYGTCTYDLCTILSRFKDDHNVTHCPLLLEQNHFPCSCPFQPGHYHINPTTFHLKRLNSAFSSFASGDFQVHANLTDTQTGELVGCYKAQLTIESECSGFLCGFLLG